MSVNMTLARARRAAFAAGFILALAATAPALAQAGNPCKSDDPLTEYDESIRRTDCNGDIGYHDWENRRPDENSTGDAGASGSAAGSGQEADYSALPTSFSGWFDSLSASDRRQFAIGLAREAEIGGADMSEQELDALMVLLRGEIDSYFDSQGLSADQRRMAIGEIAKEVGVSVAPKRASPGDEYEFGRDYGDEYDFGDESGAGDFDSLYDGWEPADPTEDFGRPSDGEPNSELDLEGW